MKKLVRESLDKEAFSKKLQDWKNHPEKYTKPEYTTPDGSTIAVIDEEIIDDKIGIITGVIVDSPIKAQIGFINTFHLSELTKIK